MSIAPYRPDHMFDPSDSKQNEVSATIAAGASLSGSINLGEYTCVGVYYPAGWTDAGATFQASRDGTNWFELVDAAGAAVTHATVVDAEFRPLDPDIMVGVRYLKVRSGTSGAAVNQVAARTLYLQLLVV